MAYECGPPSALRTPSAVDESQLPSTTFSQASLFLHVLPCKLSSRRDVAGTRHSCGHAETRQHPFHQDNVRQQQQQGLQSLNHSEIFLPSQDNCSQVVALTRDYVRHAA